VSSGVHAGSGSAVIDVRNVAKRYRRSPTGGPRRLRRFDELFRRADHWALQDVSFVVHPGESLGLVGRNGSGKSTLLRLLGGISVPTRGEIVVRRRVSGLLTLGESFQTVLSAEENAVTAAILAGLSPKQARARLPAIAAFAELEDVLDQPLRTYSDGMRLRLAFAVSVHVDPELLLIDEILAVGDLRFRRKCLDFLGQLRAHGVTVVVTSHEMGQITELCDRAVWLEDGLVRDDGLAVEVAEHYRTSMQAETITVEQPDAAGLRLGSRAVEITAVRVVTTGPASNTLHSGDGLAVEVDYHAHRPVEGAIFVVSAHAATGGARCFDLNTEADGRPLDRLEGTGTLRLALDRVDLAGGAYQLDVGVYAASWAETYDYLWAAAPFEVLGGGEAGLLQPPRTWELR
jgi:lipopolysaccharide transport system ATP-binding protein